MAWTTQTPTDTVPSADTPTPRRYRCKLDSVRAVSIEISKVYRLARSGLMPVDHASKYAHILSIVGRILTDTDLEDRLLALEAKAAA